MAMVLIKVGLRKYQASPETLLNSGYFTALLEEDPGLLEVQIDRDPQFFGPLLAYMRKGRITLSPHDMDAADKYQLFSDILFYQLEGLKHFIEDDIEVEKGVTREEVERRVKEREAELQRIKTTETDVAKVQVMASGGDPTVAPVAAPAVQPNGQGCFLCGTMDHSEASCKFSPDNKAG
eukprot:TRINITY_DN13063_c0_g1_i1.p1 TRINITY_DN13063_c0_g1~~TRINITY_DN13063_c0_g1_i1.p1  ORF type:complete len:200 (+),score=92.67 TRINITY_DN13063_c0_g1_i1:65-601(+)